MPYGGAPPQDFASQVNQGFNQMGQALNDFGNQVSQGINQGAQPYPPSYGGGPMQPYGGGAPMMMGGPPPGAMVGQSDKQWVLALILCCLGFIGFAGIHRIYTGRIVSGIIQFLTGGGCLIWTIIDLVMLLTDKFTDSQGRPLQKQQ